MKKKKHSLIWKLEMEGCPHVSYLLGTMHVKDAKAFVRMKDMKTCIDECKVFATEFNLEEADASLTADGLNLPNGETLESLLGTKKYTKIRKIVGKAFGVDLDFFNTHIPIMVANVLTESILSEDMQSSLDESLWTYAKEQEKVMMGIETFAEQMDILAKIPMDYQLKQLKEIAKSPKAFKKQIDKVATWFEDENIQQLYKSVRKSAGKIKKIMLYDRNINMVERVSQISQEQSLCFAVGAGHLWGERGLISLLKEGGFKVKPVPLSHHVTDNAVE
jgi:uncharacterized protein YbaP (TraB family)